MDAPVYCEVPIRYVAAAPSGQDPTVVITTTILDGREAGLSLDAAGIALIDMASGGLDWGDDQAVEQEHLPLVEATATELTGCDAVLFYPVIVRWSGAPEGSDLGPITTAHSDYAESYQGIWNGPGHPYRDLVRPSIDRLGLSDEQIAAARRIVTIQFWRNIGPTTPDFPLAFCDGRTVDRNELLPYLVETYAGQRTDFESLLLGEPDTRQRRWYTFPELSAEEVVVFRSFDSDRVASAEPFWTPHVAFSDPHAGPDAPPRRSVEIRAICLFW